MKKDWKKGKSYIPYQVGSKFGTGSYQPLLIGFWNGKNYDKNNWIELTFNKETNTYKLRANSDGDGSTQISFKSKSQALKFLKQYMKTH